MKISTTLLYLTSLLIFNSCTDVIDLDLTEANKKLVVEAWLTNDTDVHTVQLSLTGSYFDQNPTLRVNDAVVTITDNTGNSFILEETADGIYQDRFDLVQANTYFLHIKTIEGEEYISQGEKLSPVPSIDSLYAVYQVKTTIDDEGYFVYINSKDPIGQRNFYRWKIYINDVYQNKADNISFETDEYFNGNDITNFQFYWEPLNEGDFVKVEQLSLSENGYKFIKLMREQLTGGGIFGTPPATIKGNISSKNNPAETVLGFFGVSSIHSLKILIEGSKP